MSALRDKDLLIQAVTAELKEAFHGRGNLPRDDLEYVVSKVATLKDERLKQCITELIGWGDEQRSRVETSAAVALECMKACRPSTIREAARKVELRYHIKFLNEEDNGK